MDAKFMDANSSSTKHNSAVTNSSDKYKKVIDKVFTCVNDHLLILMDRMLVSAEEKLLEQSEKAKSEEDRMKYMDCTNIFRTEKTDISRHFFINLNQSLATVPASEMDLDQEDELSLVDQDEMEEMVAITTMHSKAMNIYGQEVHDMEARLEYLEIMCTDSFDKEAIDPKHICEVFQKTIENLNIDIDVKLIFYKLFDQEICAKLSVMYKTINKIFIDNDIMPEIILKTTKNEEVENLEPEVSSRVATYYDPNEKVATDFIPRTKEEISRVVNEFMTGTMTITGDEIDLPESFLRVPSKDDLTGKNCYHRKEVVSALSNLQRKLTSGRKDKPLTTEQIKQELLADISKNNGGVLDKQVNLLDERNMDFVGMMFDAITNDETVSQIMTNMIKQLQIPVMKVAMNDSKIFEEDEHPAKVTVDLLTTAGKGINSEQDRLYNDLESIVDNILEEYNIDIDVFDRAVDQLEDIINKEEELTRETERREQRQILQNHARDIVIDQLKTFSARKKIPGNVRPLVLKHWSTLMLNRYLKHGRDSSEWMESVLLLKLLLKCIQPIKEQSHHKMISNNHEALIEAVNDELYETRQDKTEINDQVTKLKSHFADMLEKSGFKIVDENDDDLSIDELVEYSNQVSEEELQDIQEQTELAKDKIAQLGDRAKPGVWYEIYNGEDRAVRRLKLSVVLTDAAQLIFVDRKGVKVIEKDAGDFAAELNDNRSRLLADHSTFNHALGKVMNAMAA